MFKKGDKIKCISSGSNKNITIGASYIVENVQDEGYIYLYNNIGDLRLYPTGRFSLIEKYKPTTEIEWLDKVQANFRYDNDYMLGHPLDSSPTRIQVPIPRREYNFSPPATGLNSGMIIDYSRPIPPNILASSLDYSDNTPEDEN